MLTTRPPKPSEYLLTSHESFCSTQFFSEVKLRSLCRKPFLPLHITSWQVPLICTYLLHGAESFLRG